MAAPTKKGLDYYPRDVNLMTDRKFRKPKMKHGYLAIGIYEALLELIYGDEGYYVRYSDNNKEDVAWDILDRIRGKYNVEAETIYEVIGMLVECELFSDYHFKQGIITSKRIQKTYYRSTLERKNVEVDKKIWFLTISEMEAISTKSSILPNFINQPNNEDNQPSNGDNQPNNEQSKVNESKVNKSKVEGEESKSSPGFTPPTLQEIEEYSKSENISINCEKFFSHYEANNWKIKGEPLTNWKARVKSWYIEDKERAEKSKGTSKPNNRFNDYTQKVYSDEEIEEMLKRKAAKGL